MRYLIPILSLLLCVQLSRASERLNIALVAVDGAKSAPGNVSTYVQTLLEEELGKSGKFDLVERSRVKEVIEEIAFQQSGVTDQDGAVEIGKHLNVDQLIFVQTHCIYPDYELTLKVVDVASNRILRVEKTGLGQKTPEIQIAVRRLARRLIALSSLFSSVEMAFIPSGSFLMGSDRGLADERPPHRVSIDAFHLDRYEVTHIAYQEFLVTQGKKKRADLKDPDHPATMVSWIDAASYCQAQGKRLPTEAEWEVAADQSGATPEAGTFFDDGAWHPRPLDAATLEPGRLHQLYGDCWEWTGSAYLPYPGYRRFEGPLGEYNGKFMVNQMVLRGGSCATSRDHVRSTYRNFFKCDKRWQFKGIRLADESS